MRGSNITFCLASLGFKTSVTITTYFSFKLMGLKKVSSLNAFREILNQMQDSLAFYRFN